MEMKTFLLMMVLGTVTCEESLFTSQAGESIHFQVVLPEKVRMPTVELDIRVGTHRVQIDGESSFLHQGEEMEQLFVRIPHGVVAGDHHVTMHYLNTTVLKQTILVEPLIKRVVKNSVSNMFHIDGSGFALDSTQVTVDGYLCTIHNIDFHHIDCDTGRYYPEVYQTHIRKVPGIKLNLASNEMEYLKAGVSWPLRYPRNTNNLHSLDADSLDTFLVAPETGSYSFQAICHGGQDECGEFTVLDKSRNQGQLNLKQGEVYPVSFSFRGQGYRLAVSIVSGNMAAFYEHVPASWFHFNETYNTMHDVQVTSNGMASIHRYPETVVVDAAASMDLYSLDRRALQSSTSNARLLQEPVLQKFSEWRAASGCTECVIPYGTHLIVDQNIDVDSLTIRGSLYWDTAAMSGDSRLETGFLMVENGGSFELNGGASTSSNRATLYIKRNGKKHQKFGEQSVGTSNDVESELPAPVFKVTGREMRTWSLLQGATHLKGSNTLTLAHDAHAMGWSEGDRIVIANTDIPTIHQTTFLGPQVAVIDKIQGNKVTIRGDTLNQDFFADEETQMQAEVINLSRNVEITGDEFENLKGLHVIGAYGGVMQVSYTKVSKCGRRGEKGRYCLHFHVLGDCPSCAFVGNAIEDSNQRGIVVHGTHRSMTEYNVLYMVRGSGIYVEDGNEMHNTIQYNVNVCHSSGTNINACRATGTADDQADDIQQSGLWSIAMTNDLIGNRMVNHYNGLFTQVSLFPHGQGYAAGKVCTVHAPLGIMQGNVHHSNMRFGFYLDNNWPRDLKRDDNGFVVDIDKCGSSDAESPCSCDPFKADGSDNGLLGVVEDGLDYGNTFVGQYELGDVQYLRFRSINNLHNMYWKVTKNFADGYSSHIKDSLFEYYPLPGYPGAGVGHIMGPGGLGSFVIENTKFIGHMVEGGICANQHCTVAGTGALCTPEYTLVKTDLTGMPTNMKWLRFGISDGDPERPIFTSPDGSIPGAVSIASKYMTYLLDMEENGVKICAKASDSDHGTVYDDGIVCSKPLRRLQMWTKSNLGTLRLTSDAGSSHDMKFIDPCPGTSKLCVRKQGYGIPVLVGHEYHIDVNPSNEIIWEFSDKIFASRFKSDESIHLKFADQSVCHMKNTHDRRFISPQGPVGNNVQGACP